MSDRKLTRAASATDAATWPRTVVTEVVEIFSRVDAQLKGLASMLDLGRECAEIDWRSSLEIVRGAQLELLGLPELPGRRCEGAVAAGAKLAAAEALIGAGIDDVEIDWPAALTLVRQAQHDLGSTVAVMVASPEKVPHASAPASSPEGSGDASSDDDEGAGAASDGEVVSLTREADRAGYIAEFSSDPVILNPAATLRDIIALSAARAEALDHMVSVLSTCGGAGCAFEPHQIADFFVGPVEDLLRLLREAAVRVRREDDRRSIESLAAGAARDDVRGRS